MPATPSVDPEVINAILLGLSIIESSVQKDSGMTKLVLEEIGLPQAVVSLAAAGNAILEIMKIENSDGRTTEESIRFVREQVIKMMEGTS